MVPRSSISSNVNFSSLQWEDVVEYTHSAQVAFSVASSLQPQHVLYPPYKHQPIKSHQFYPQNYVVPQVPHMYTFPSPHMIGIPTCYSSSIPYQYHPSLPSIPRSHYAHSITSYNHGNGQSMDTQSVISNPQAHMVSVAPVVQHDSSWFPDSGATNHLTNASPSSYNACVPYNSQGKVTVGNGSSLNISIIGSAVIPRDVHTTSINSRRLILHNILSTPSVKKKSLVCI